MVYSPRNATFPLLVIVSETAESFHCILIFRLPASSDFKPTTCYLWSIAVTIRRVVSLTL